MATDYGPVRPLPYAVMRARLEAFDVIECGESDDASGPCRVLRFFKMGVGTGTYYNFPFDGNKAIVPEPEIIAVLDYFEIERADFMNDCPEAGEAI